MRNLCQKDRSAEFYAGKNISNRQHVNEKEGRNQGYRRLASGLF